MWMCHTRARPHGARTRVRCIARRRAGHLRCFEDSKPGMVSRSESAPRLYRIGWRQAVRGCAHCADTLLTDHMDVVIDCVRVRGVDPTRLNGN